VVEISERLVIAEVVQRLTRRYAQLPPDHASHAMDLRWRDPGWLIQFE
jgi:hypothetical protein